VKTAVDSSVLFDILKGAKGAAAAQQSLEKALAQGSLCASAIVVAELGRYFEQAEDLLEFLAACQIEHDPLNIDTAIEAARIMRRYSKNKGPRDRVAPDFIIGAHALKQADALISTDDGFFRHYFDGLRVLTP
jgi:predicted nucleic acid-binding protein